MSRRAEERETARGQSRSDLRSGSVSRWAARTLRVRAAVQRTQPTAARPGLRLRLFAPDGLRERGRLLCLSRLMMRSPLCAVLTGDSARLVATERFEWTDG